GLVPRAQLPLGSRRLAREQLDDAGGLRGRRRGYTEAELLEDLPAVGDCAPRLVEVALHRLEACERADDGRAHAPLHVRLRERLFAAADSVGGRRRAEPERAGELVLRLRLAARVSGAARVLECAAERRLRLGGAAAEPRHPCKQLPRL